MAISNLVTGSLYAILAFFLIAIFGILTKMALNGGSPFFVSFIIYGVGTLLLIPYIAKKGFSFLKSEHYFKLIGRAVFGTIASLTYTISIQYIPIVNGTLLFNTAPVFIPFLMMLFLNKKIQKSTWIAVFMGFIGIIVIVKPTTTIFMEPGNLIALFSGFSLAIAFVLMKLLTATEPIARILFYFFSIGTLIQVPGLFFSESTPTSESVTYSLVGGFILFLGQIALVKGYKYADASKIGIYQYTSVIFVGFFEWMLWDVVPTGGEFMGVLLVMLAGIIIIRNG